jgi:RimJ/RimL family protein N-acetyltransferase
VNMMSANPDARQVEQWIASDGNPITIRPMRPSDLELEMAFVHGLSADTAYKRLMSSRRLSDDELKRLTDVDHVREVALIAVVTFESVEHQIGVARFVIDALSRDAEFAIVLSDAWQNRGLGTKLLDSLIAAANDLGVHHLTGPMMSTNAAMIALARKSGFKIVHDPSDWSVTNMSLNLSHASPGADH